MIEMYTPSVFRDNLSIKIILAPLLSRERCKKYTETLSFPPKTCRHKHCLATLKNCSRLANHCLSNDREHPPASYKKKTKRCTPVLSKFLCCVYLLSIIVNRGPRAGALAG